jgi:hypothetical protein
MDQPPSDSTWTGAETSKPNRAGIETDAHREVLASADGVDLQYKVLSAVVG